MDDFRSNVSSFFSHFIEGKGSQLKVRKSDHLNDQLSFFFCLGMIGNRVGSGGMNGQSQLYNTLLNKSYKIAAVFKEKYFILFV